MIAGNASRRSISALGATLAASAALLAANASPAAAAAPSPAWSISSTAMPTRFAPESSGNVYQLTIVNSGGAVAEPGVEPITVTDTLPAGLKATAIGALQGKVNATGILGSEGEDSAGSCELATLTCTFAGAGEDLYPGRVISVYVEVEVQPGAEEVLTNTATVSGGTAIHSASTSDPTAISSSPAGPGAQDFTFESRQADGSPARQAGSHPYATTAGFFFNLVDAVQVGGGETKSGLFPAQNGKDVEVVLPPGLIGDPRAVPACPPALAKAVPAAECPADTQVGTALVWFGGAKSEEMPNGAGGRFSAPAIYDELPVYNIVPQAGAPAEFSVVLGKAPQMIVARVHSDGNYTVATLSPDITETEQVLGVLVSFWGVPGEASHDSQRGLTCSPGGCGFGGQPFTGLQPKPFLSNPTRCGQALQASLSADFWQTYESGLTESFVSEVASQPALLGCDKLRFQPTIEATPNPYPATPDSPSGLNVGIEVPQAEAVNTLATPDVKDVTVTLPQGMTISPSSAGGLVACPATGPDGINLGSGQLTPLGADKLDPQATEKDESDSFYHAVPGHCPQGSQLGEVEVETPLLEKPLTGHIYLAQPGCDPCTEMDAEDGKMIGLYLEASGFGVVVKLPGVVKTNRTTGRITSTFEDTPQLPFSDLRVKFKSGPRAPLSTPDSCGTYTTESDLTPWSAPETPDAKPLSSFTLQGCSPPAFAPLFAAGTTNNQAGAFSPFTMSLTRNDGEQSLNTIALRMPPGIAGMIAKVPQCGQVQANAGACPAASQIGTTSVDAGPGPDAYHIEGKVYLTGPYGGAPFGLSIVVPAVAGPFHLAGTNGAGEVVVRAKIEVDPHTAQVTVISDPLPQMLDGIPLQLKFVNVSVDREGFVFNPTSCEPMSVTGSLGSAEGASHAVSARFQAAGCAALPFHPTFTASTSSRTSRKKGASLTVKIGYAEGQANVRRVHVQLPKQLPSRLATLNHACPEAQFDANPAGCPKGSIVGSARAVTPILGAPLTGPAYFVSHGGAKFPELILVLQGEGVTIDLAGETFIKGKITTSTFGSVPDAPVSSFTLTLPEGENSALAAPGGKLCKQKLVMPTVITGQNGAQITQKTKIHVTGCAAKKHRKKRKAHGHKHAQEHRRGHKHKRK